MPDTAQPTVDMPSGNPSRKVLGATVPAKDSLTAIPPSRHPFQLWCLLACILGGAGNLVDSKSAINQLLPHYIVVIWALTLMLSGILGIWGAFSRDRINGLLLERAGLTTLGTAAIAYGAGIAVVAGQPAIFSGALTASIGIASLWRVAHVNRELKVLQRFISRTHLARE
jgi:hypothetical protein